MPGDPIQALTHAQAASLLDVTSRRLSQINNEDSPPVRNDDGTYPAVSFGQWLEQRTLSRLAVFDDGTILDYQAERARLTCAQADNEELKFQEKKGELIPAEEVAQAWVGHVLAARAVLLALPTKIAPAVMGASTLREVETFARDEIFRALDALENKASQDQRETA